MGESGNSVEYGVSHNTGESGKCLMILVNLQIKMNLLVLVILVSRVICSGDSGDSGNPVNSCDSCESGCFSLFW